MPLCYCEGSVSRTYKKVKEALKKGDMDVVRDLCDLGILLVAQERYNENRDVDYPLDGVRIGLWLERFWYTLENNDLLLE